MGDDSDAVQRAVMQLFISCEVLEHRSIVGRLANRFESEQVEDAISRLAGEAFLEMDDEQVRLIDGGDWFVNGAGTKEKTVQPAVPPEPQTLEIPYGNYVTYEAGGNQVTSSPIVSDSVQQARSNVANNAVWAESGQQARTLQTPDTVEGRLALLSQDYPTNSADERPAVARAALQCHLAGVCDQKHNGENLGWIGGVVLDIKWPKRTANSLMMTVTLATLDKNVIKKVDTRLFGADMKSLPKIQNFGDLLFLERCKKSVFRGDDYWNANTDRCKFAVFDAATGICLAYHRQNQFRCKEQYEAASSPGLSMVDLLRSQAVFMAYHFPLPAQNLSYLEAERQGDIICEVKSNCNEKNQSGQSVHQFVDVQGTAGTITVDRECDREFTVFIKAASLMHKGNPWIYFRCLHVLDFFDHTYIFKSMHDDFFPSSALALRPLGCLRFSCLDAFLPDADDVSSPSMVESTPMPSAATKNQPSNASPKIPNPSATGSTQPLYVPPEVNRTCVSPTSDSGSSQSSGGNAIKSNSDGSTTTGHSPEKENRAAGSKRNLNPGAVHACQNPKKQKLTELNPAQSDQEETKEEEEQEEEKGKEQQDYQVTTMQNKLAGVKEGASFWQDLKALHAEMGLL